MNTALLFVFALLPYLISAGSIPLDTEETADATIGATDEETVSNTLASSNTGNTGNTLGSESTVERNEMPDFNSTRLAELKKAFEATTEESSDRSFFMQPGYGYAGAGLNSGCTWIMNSPGRAVCCRYDCYRVYYCYYY